GVRERAGRRAQDIHGRGHGQGALFLENGVERLPLDELHHDEQNAPELPYPVHGDDVRMIDLGHHARLALEALPGAGREPELWSRIMSFALAIFDFAVSESRPAVRSKTVVSDDHIVRCGPSRVVPPAATTTLNGTVLSRWSTESPT